MKQRQQQRWEQNKSIAWSVECGKRVGAASVAHPLVQFFDEVKVKLLRFWGQRPCSSIYYKPFIHCLLHENYYSSERTLRIFCTYDQHGIITTHPKTHGSILMLRFHCSCLGSFLNSLFFDINTTVPTAS